LNSPLPTVNEPETGLSLLNGEALSRLQIRYQALANEVDAPHLEAYVRGILRQINELEQQGRLDWETRS
jgi:hypothetical protein